MSAGEHGGAGGHAPGAVVGGKEADALFGEAVDVGCFDPGVGFFVATEGAVGVVVGVDEEDVGAFGGGGGLHGEGGGGGEGAKHLAAGQFCGGRHFCWAYFNNIFRGGSITGREGQFHGYGADGLLAFGSRGGDRVGLFDGGSGTVSGSNGLGTPGGIV